MKTLETAFTAQFEALNTKLGNRTARLGVIGLGYVGLPLVLLFSEQKFRVTGFDIDEKKVKTLSEGGSYIVRIPGTEIQSAQAAGFTPTTDYSRISDMDAVIIAVPTPLDDHHEPDLSFIEATAKSIAPHLRPGQLVVLESTTYPGTTEELLVPILEKNPLSLKAARAEDYNDKTFFVAFSPEREDPGNDTVARCDIPKVVGGLNQAATELCRSLYGTIFHRTVPVSTPAAAEMTKLLENIYRCVNIALVNELKVLILGVAYKKDIDDLRESPSLTIIELLQKEGAEVSYNDPYFEYVGQGRKYKLQMSNTPLENLDRFDAVVI